MRLNHLRRILALRAGRPPRPSGEPSPSADYNRASQAAFYGSLGLIALIVVFDVATGPVTNISGTVAMAPFLAATLCSVRRTVIVTVVAITAGVTLLVVNETTLVGSYGPIYALAFAAVVATLAGATRQRREQRIADLTRVADVAQRALLIQAPPVVGPVEVATRYQSASSDALVGGDLYAVVESDFGVRILLGDVRGKGLESVAQAAAVLSTFRELAGISPTLVALVLGMEDRLRHYLHGEDFVTAVLAEIDDTGAARLVSCGHPPPLLIRDGTYEPVALADYATPFGLRPQPTVRQLWVRKGERLLFYSDGLIETRTRSGGFLSLDDILVGITRDDLEAALGAAVDRIEELAGHVRDDLALLLVEFHGRPGLRGPAKGVDPFPWQRGPLRGRRPLEYPLEPREVGSEGAADASGDERLD